MPSAAGKNYSSRKTRLRSDAPEVDDRAVTILENWTPKGITRELVETVRNNVTIDWTLRQAVRARLRVMVKRIL